MVKANFIFSAIPLYSVVLLLFSAILVLSSNDLKEGVHTC